MAGVMIMITMMNHEETANKQSDFFGFETNFESQSICVCVCVCVCANIFIIVIKLPLQFQIWFYTNDIFKKAGIPEPLIQYTTVGTGAIEVISGMLGVSTHVHTLDTHVILYNDILYYVFAIVAFWHCELGMSNLIDLINERIVSRLIH